MVGKRAVLLIFIATLSILLLGLPGKGQTVHSAAWFDTGATTQLTCTNSCVGNPYAPGKTADFSSDFNIASPSLNYDYMLISFMPPDFEIAHSSDIPEGSKVGELDADSTIAILNQNCNGATPVHFDLYWATTDTSDTFSLYPGNENGWTDECEPGNNLPNLVDCYPTFLNRLLDPDGEGPKAPMVPRSRSVGQTNVAGSQVVIQFVQFNPGQLSGVDGFASPHNWSQFTEEWGYPSIIVLQQPGAPAVPISITTFCTPLASTTNLYGVAQAGLGGTTGGEQRQANPAAGTGVAKSDGTGTNTHLYLSYARSYRNIDDGDELESEIDTCPYAKNQDDFRLWTGADGDLIDPVCDTSPANVGDPDGDAFSSGQDNCPQVYNQRDNCLLVANPAQTDGDFDFLGLGCDPNDTIANINIDGDGVTNNRDDNCPFIPNTDQADTDGDGIGDACDPDFGNPNPPYYNVDPDGDTVPAIHIYDSENAPAPFAPDRADGGPKSDGIGDACDLSPETADGYYFATFGITPICIGDPVQDTDGDGWCNATETALGDVHVAAGTNDHDGDTIPNLHDPDAYDPDDDPPIRGPYCTTANQTDCDDNCPIHYNPSQTDTDGDGFGDVCDLNYPHRVAGDYDGDTLADGVDPCPQAHTVPFPPAADTDNDGIGNICDPKPNLDWSPLGRPEHHALEFAMPLHDAGASPPMDERTGMDGMQQVCDDGIDNDGDTFIDGDDPDCSNDGNPDTDGDGIDDANDYCRYLRNQTQTDTDGDGAGNVCDPDDDSDADNPKTPDAQEWVDGTDPLFNNTDDVVVDRSGFYFANLDTDGDGGMDWEERWSGTDPWDDCGDDCLTDGLHDAWGLDLFRDCWAQFADDLMYPANMNIPGVVTMPVKLGNIGMGAGITYLARYDLNGDNWVNATDRGMWPPRIFAITGGGTMPYMCTNP